MHIVRHGTREIAGVQVTAHRREFGEECWYNTFLIRRPANAKRGWLRDLLTSFRFFHSIGCSGPGQFFAGHPILRRVGRGRLYGAQRCGYDV